jgi:tRNA(Ile)-lysidine synthase
MSAPLSGNQQPTLPFEAATKLDLPPEGLALATPGAVTLPDSRAISAELIQASPAIPIPQNPTLVELDPKHMSAQLRVRFAAPGDRFFPLGAPGSRRLSRFLADAGVPKEERQRVPLVFAGDELIWVAGIRPCEPRKVSSHTEVRLRLTLSRSAK